MNAISDMHKEVYWVKSVPDTEPGADGEWTTVFIHPRYANNYGYINTLLPRGFHCVASTKRNPHRSEK